MQYWETDGGITARFSSPLLQERAETAHSGSLKLKWNCIWISNNIITLDKKNI